MESPRNDDATASAGWPFHTEVPPGRIELQRQLVESDPFFRLLGVRFHDGGPDTATLVLPFRADLVQPTGILHGGLHGILIDSAIAQALLTTIRPAFSVVTVHLDTKYFAPVRGGEVLATATVRAEGEADRARRGGGARRRREADRARVGRVRDHRWRAGRLTDLAAGEEPSARAATARALGPSSRAHGAPASAGHASPRRSTSASDFTTATESSSDWRIACGTRARACTLRSRRS